MKKQCYECKFKREAYAAITQLENGWVLWVCKKCWDRLDYTNFIQEPK